MESLEQRRVAVDVHQIVDAHIAAGERQESGGINVSLVGDEDDAVAVADSESTVDRGLLDLVAGMPFRAHLVQSDAAIGGRLGGLYRKRRLLGEIVGPVHQLFAVLRSDRLELLAAAHCDQVEEAPAHDLVLLQELVDCRQVVGGLLRDEGVDLDGEAHLSGVADGSRPLRGRPHGGPRSSRRARGRASRCRRP